MEKYPFDVHFRIYFNRHLHGSGFDGNWNQEMLKSGKVRLTMDFHCMNDVGYYDGWANFSVVFKRNDWENFKVHFHGPDSNYLARKYMLRDFIESEVYEVLKESIKNL